jgi:hypothetical protein
VAVRTRAHVSTFSDGDLVLNTRGLEPPELATVQVAFTPVGLVLSGTITTKEPGSALGSFFRAVHELSLAERVQELCVDVRALTSVNSSALRLFIDWAIWVSQPPGASYKLRFIRSPHVTWQRISFPPLAQLAAKHLILEDGA